MTVVFSKSQTKVDIAVKLKVFSVGVVGVHFPSKSESLKTLQMHSNLSAITVLLVQ